MSVSGTHYRPVWMDGSLVRMIDQRWLPHRFTVVDLPTVAVMCAAIRDVRDLRERRGVASVP